MKWLFFFIYSALWIGCSFVKHVVHLIAAAPLLGSLLLLAMMQNTLQMFSKSFSLVVLKSHNWCSQLKDFWFSLTKTQMAKNVCTFLHTASVCLWRTQQVSSYLELLVTVSFLALSMSTPPIMLSWTSSRASISKFCFTNRNCRTGTVLSLMWDLYLKRHMMIINVG